MTLEIQGQTQMAPRLQFLLTNHFEGELDVMARCTGANKAVLRDILRGRTVNTSTLRDTVRRVALHPKVSGAWLKTGQGSALRRPGEVSEATSTGEEGSIMATKKDDLDVFVTFTQRLQKLEHAMQTLPKPPDTTKAFEAVHKRMDQLADLTHRIDSGLTNALMIAKDSDALSKETSRISGRLEAAMVALRGDLDGVKAEIVAIQEAVTKPEKTTRNWEPFFTIAGFMDFGGSAADYFIEHHVTLSVIDEFLEVATIAAGVAEHKDMNNILLYRYEHFGILRDYFERELGGKIENRTPRGFAAFFKGCLADAEKKNGQLSHVTS